MLNPQELATNFGEWIPNGCFYEVNAKISHINLLRIKAKYPGHGAESCPLGKEEEMDEWVKFADREDAGGSVTAPGDEAALITSCWCSLPWDWSTDITSILLKCQDLFL